MNFTETDEQQALRKAVAELGKRYGHDYAPRKARAREPLDRAVGRGRASSASSGSTCPSSTAAAGPACTSSRIVVRGARRGRLRRC